MQPTVFSQLSLEFIPKMGINIPNMGRTKPKKAKQVRAGASPKLTQGTSLSDALFTATQQRVLRLLFGQPERSFFASELIAMIRSGSGAIQRELVRLVESGLVTSREIGRQKHYQANRSAPIFEELCGIVRKTFGVADPLRQALQSLQVRIDSASIYGSVAKGTDKAGSDIDLLVVSDKLMLEDLFRVLDPAEQLLGRKVNPTLIKGREFVAQPKSDFLRKVMSGPRIPLIGEL